MCSHSKSVGSNIVSLTPEKLSKYDTLCCRTICYLMAKTAAGYCRVLSLLYESLSLSCSFNTCYLETATV